jgi:hypothetical protein
MIHALLAAAAAATSWVLAWVTLPELVPMPPWWIAYPGTISFAPLFLLAFRRVP